MIKLRYSWRIFIIYARKYVALARITLAGRLIKLAFWISPYLEEELSKGFIPSGGYDEPLEGNVKKL